MVEFVDIHTHGEGGANISLTNLAFVDEPISNHIYSFGIHPWDIKDLNFSKAINEVISIIESHKNIVAVGECGVDRAIKTPVEIQFQFFTKQYELSEQYKLPLIIHCVKAYSDFQALIKKLKPTQPWIFHGFSSNAEIAKDLIARGCYLSFGKMLLNNTKVQNVFSNLPIESVFFETDNSAEKIENIYKKAAELRHICISELKHKIWLNYNKVFNK